MKWSRHPRKGLCGDLFGDPLRRVGQRRRIASCRSIATAVRPLPQVPASRPSGQVAANRRSKPGHFDIGHQAVSLISDITGDPTLPARPRAFHAIAESGPTDELSFWTQILPAMDE